MAVRLTATSIAVAVLAALPAPASAEDEARRAAMALKSDPVYVQAAEAGRLSVAERGALRIAIVRNAIGRITVAVVSPQAARESGGVAGFAAGIGRANEVRGTLIVVAGPDYYVLTSYPDSDAATAALRTAVDNHRSLARQLHEAIERIGKVDPGPSTDPGGIQSGGGSVPETDDFFDDITDTFRLVGLIIAAAIALPFILFAIWLVLRYRRSRARREEAEEHGERTVRDELVALGDAIRSLDLDTSMPDANRAALADYEQAIARYDQANGLLIGDPSEYQVQQAQAAIAAGLRHIEAARARLA